MTEDVLIRDTDASGAFDDELSSIFTIVKAATGHDFSFYKANTVVRRIERRMAVNEVREIKRYLELLEENPQEPHALSQDILIGVTSFFRDPDAFENLRKVVIPRLFAGKSPGEPVRIWHACCASGEEVYSMAMLIKEYLHEHRLDVKVQFFATDLDEKAISQARSGLYPEEIVSDIGEERLQRFFTRVDGLRQVSKSLREMVLFAHHSVIKDPPFSQLDLLVCRNFLIYLNQDMQKRLIGMFHKVLKPDAFLFLGSAESASHDADLFIPIDKKWKMFTRRDTKRRPDSIFPFTTAVRIPGRIRTARPVPAEEPNPAALAEKLLKERYSPPCVVVNDKYEVVHVSTRANRFLEIPVGEPTRDILRMAREDLRPLLRAAIYKAFSEQTPVLFRGVRIEEEHGEIFLNVEVEPLDTGSSTKTVAMVILDPVSPPFAPFAQYGPGNPVSGNDTSKDILIRQLEEQLRITHGQLLAVTEQLESSHEGFLATSEELMSINEEFQSANEELQSTNEELETSKEELQSLNEEMVTVNVELQEKVEQLNLANSDMENLFASSETATVFLDRNLVIKRFSPAMAVIFKLKLSDIDRPFGLFAEKINWTTLRHDAELVMDGQSFAEREVVLPDNGSCYLKRVFPYRTVNGKIDGIVIKLIDITMRKQAEEATRSAALFPLENPNPVLRITRDGRLLFSNRVAEPMLAQWRTDFLNGFPEVFFSTIESALESGVILEFDLNVFEREFIFSVIPFQERDYANIYGRDSSEQRRAEKSLLRAKEDWERTFNSVPDLIAILDDQHRIVRVNQTMAERLGLTPEACIGLHCFSGMHGSECPPGSCPHALTLSDGQEHRAELHVEHLGADFLVSTTPLLDEDGRMAGAVHVARDITELKKAELALSNSEKRVRLKLESILSPEGNLGNLELADIINVEAIQSLMNNFYRLRHIPMAIIDLKGKVLVGAGWQDICTRFHRVHKETCKHCVESDIELTSGISAGEFKLYKCKNSMWDVATPLMVGGRKLGNLFSGQFFFDDEKIDYDFFKGQAHQYGFDETEYLAALERVTRISREMLSASMDYFVELADLISKQSYANLKLARSLAERDSLTDKLQQSKERLSRAQEIAHLGSWELDLSNNSLFWSDEAYRIFGLEPQEFDASYEAFLEAVHPDDRASVNAAYSDSLNNGIDNYEIEHRIVRKPDGEVRVVHEKCEHFRDESGRIIRSVGMVHDITDRKRFEELLQKANNSLEILVMERTEELTNTVDALQLEIFERVTAQESLLRLNSLYALLSETNQIIVRAGGRETLFHEFCRAAVDQGGFLLSWIGLVDNQYGQVKMVASCGKTGYLDDIRVTVNEEPHGLGPTGISIREKSYCICNDFQNDPNTRPWHDRGRAYGIGSSASVALKEEGRVVGALTLYAEEAGFFDKQPVELLLQMGADLSFALDNFCLEARRREIEQALHDETLERLRTVEALREKEQLLIQQSRLAAMGEMIGNIAHQWRQPLNLLALKIQQMQMYYENGLFSAEFLDETVAKSMQQIKHMSQTIDDFRHYFIPDKEKTEFSPNEVISATFTLLRDGFKHQHIDLELLLPSLDEQMIFGFPNEYSQALLNILLNAKDALLERKPPAPRVTVTIFVENGRSVVLINDNAGGIPDGVIEKIFDPYFTTKGPHEGTGVGLFMSRTIIEKNMQGRLTVRNTAEGAEFRIEV